MHDLDLEDNAAGNTPNVRRISINGCTFTINNNVYSVNVVLNGQEKENHDFFGIVGYHGNDIGNVREQPAVLGTGLSIVDQQQQPTSCKFIQIVQSLFTRQAHVARASTHVFVNIVATIPSNLVNTGCTALNDTSIIDVINAQRVREMDPSLRTFLPLKQHRNFKFNDRLHVVNKMAATVFDENWPSSILMAAVNYLDRYLGNSKKNTVNSLAATEVGIVCINLAAKMNIECDLDHSFDNSDQNVLKTKFDLLNSKTKNVLSCLLHSRSTSRVQVKSTFFVLEREVLRSLDSKLLVVTPSVFLKEFLIVQCLTGTNVKEIACL